MLSRRGFILSGTALGGGLILAYANHQLDDGDAASKFAAAGRSGWPLNAWIKIDTNDEVTFAIHRAEMGQGVVTGLAQLLAEELDADWSRVRFEFPPVDRDYYNFAIVLDGRPLGDPTANWWAGAGTWAMREVFHAMGISLTAASVSMIDAWDTLRPAGAAARQMLIAAAARRWRCPADRLRTEPGVVIDDDGGRRASYGELAEAAAAEKPPSRPRLKAPEDYRLIGRSLPRLDTPVKVTGEAIYCSDIILPDMLFAAVVHSPVSGTRFASFDSGGAEDLPGVEGVVPADENSIVVVASDTWSAMRAAERVRVIPDLRAAPGNDGPIELVNSNIAGEQYLASLDNPGNPVLRNIGDAAGAIDSADTSVAAVYEVPFLAHECMEPMNCTAHYTGDRLEVWAPSQSNSMSRDVAAEVAGLDKSQVRVHSTFIGGAFGRRSEMDFVRQAVSTAVRFRDRPIKLTWSRQQDMRHDQYRPLAVARMRGAVDEAGAMTAIDYALATQSVGASYGRRNPSPRRVDERTDISVMVPLDKPIYRIDNLRLSYAPVTSHVPAGYWRSVSFTWNPFFLECFVDELAAAAGTDPLTFRRRALSGRPRHLRVLDELSRIAGMPQRGRGFAIVETHGSVVGHAIDVETHAGKFHRVKRVICVIDCGRVIHPDGVSAQTEGCIIDALAAALYGQIDIRDGVVAQRNFDTHARFGMGETPEIQVNIVKSANRPGGAGEVGLPGVAPALCNAIFDATGVRVRKLPVAPRV